VLNGSRCRKWATVVGEGRNAPDVVGAEEKNGWTGAGGGLGVDLIWRLLG
jgi:hypothetical protein